MLISLRKFECFWRAFVELFVAVHRPAPPERCSLRCRVVVRLSRTISCSVPSCKWYLGPPCVAGSCETASFVHALTKKKTATSRDQPPMLPRPRQSSLPALGRHPHVHGKVFRSVVVGPSASVQHRNGSILGARVAGFLVRVKCGADVHSQYGGFLCVEILWMIFAGFSHQKEDSIVLSL